LTRVILDLGRWIKIWWLGSAQAVRAALGVAGGERNDSVGAGGEQTAAELAGVSR